MKAAMQRRVEEAIAETEAKAAGLCDAHEKKVHFSACGVALNARVAAQQKDLRALTSINALLTQELEELRAHRAAQAAEPGPAENGGALCIFSLNCRDHSSPLCPVAVNAASAEEWNQV